MIFYPFPLAMDESLQQRKHSKNDQYHKDKDAELLESLKNSPKFTADMYRISRVYTELFGTEYLGNYYCYTDEGAQCTDGSDLYTLVKYEGKDLIVKVGAGEFNTKVFTTGNVKELKWFYNSPVPLFVVNQGHIYLGNEEDREQRAMKPKEYLDSFAVIVSPKWGEAKYRPNQERHEGKIDYNHIHIRHYDEALAAGRLAILKKEFPNGEFSNAMYMLKRIKLMDFDQFYKQIRKGKEYLSDDMNRLIWCLRHMWVNTVGSGVGDKEAYMSLYDLIQTFDVYKETFITLQ